MRLRDRQPQFRITQEISKGDEEEAGTWGHLSGGGLQGEDVFHSAQIDINDQYKVEVTRTEPLKTCFLLIPGDQMWSHSWEEKCGNKLVLDLEDTCLLE